MFFSFLPFFLSFLALRSFMVASLRPASSFNALCLNTPLHLPPPSLLIFIFEFVHLANTFYRYCQRRPQTLLDTLLSTSPRLSPTSTSIHLHNNSQSPGSQANLPNVLGDWTLLCFCDKPIGIFYSALFNFIFNFVSSLCLSLTY